MSYPTGYDWLARAEPLPRVIAEGLALHGTKEVAGPKNNPEILGWAKEIGVASVYTQDSIPWCGAFVAVVCKRAGKPVDNQPLWARSWADYGDKSPDASLGDILVFQRPGGGGHVGFYIAEDVSAYHVLGGNQGDAVSIARIAKSRCIAVRRPPVKTALPASAKPYQVAMGGRLSTNEA
jgi:uncharacterized protein (TIGR02594 family)